LTAPPCAGNGIGAIPRAHPAGLFVRHRRNVMGTGKSDSSAHRSRVALHEPLLLILGSRQPWRGHAGNVRRIARTMRARSLHIRGRTCNEPQHAFTHRRRRRGSRGHFSWLLLFG
jgi:hypothetical protein